MFQRQPQVRHILSEVRCCVIQDSRALKKIAVYYEMFSLPCIVQYKGGVFAVVACDHVALLKQCSGVGLLEVLQKL